MQNLYTNSIHKSNTVSSTKKQLQIHEPIYDKLRSFHKNNKIPHLIFHGASGSGKRTIVNRFLNIIYENEKSRMKNNIMTVNCAHGKGIKFIRDECFIPRVGYDFHRFLFEFIQLGYHYSSSRHFCGSSSVILHRR